MRYQLGDAMSNLSGNPRNGTNDEWDSYHQRLRYTARGC